MILEILLICLAVLILFIIGMVGKGIGVYNIFKIGQQDIKTQWSNILTEYQRRADLFYNLVQAVKSHKNFEKETLIQVIKARNSFNNLPETKGAQMKHLKNLDGLFSRLLVTVEQYPQLQSFQQHNKLMEEIRITEDRVNVARTDYNEIVGDYNKVVTTFPNNIFANMFRVQPEQFFKNELNTTSAPKINLE
jgi:LemA protein